MGKSLSSTCRRLFLNSLYGPLRKIKLFIPPLSENTKSGWLEWNSLSEKPEFELNLSLQAVWVSMATSVAAVEYKQVCRLSWLDGSTDTVYTQDPHAYTYTQAQLRYQQCRLVELNVSEGKWNYHGSLWDQLDVNRCVRSDDLTDELLFIISHEYLTVLTQFRHKWSQSHNQRSINESQPPYKALSGQAPSYLKSRLQTWCNEFLSVLFLSIFYILHIFQFLLLSVCLWSYLGDLYNVQVFILGWV